MTITPSLEQARQLAEEYTVLPIALEMFADLNTSIGVLNNIRQRDRNCFLLESVTTSDGWSRYSFLGCEPSLVLSGVDGEVFARQDGRNEALEGSPPEVIRRVLARYLSPHIPGLPPFTGGLVGYFSYEFARYFEPSLQLRAENPEGFDDFRLMLVDKVIAFDHFRQKIVLMVNIPVENLEAAYIDGVAALKDMEALVRAHLPIPPAGSGVRGPFTARFSKEEYGGVVERVKTHIREGDIFQAVPSNRFSAPFEGDLFATYRVLRTVNPSPYMVYLNIDDVEVACASPETLVSLREGRLHTYPLAGTCGRGKTPEQDAELEAALMADEKELAEHDMLVDLGRNDLGKISAFGSVGVEEYRAIKQFSHVSHIASRVAGRIAPEYDAVDAVGAVLPAGTLSGAPKKRAMEIIDEVEGTRRGLYGGAIGYLDFAGNLDLCIGIRMAVRKGGTVYVQSGGGVVAESRPDAEYEETRRKAQAVMDALQAGRRENGSLAAALAPTGKEHLA